MLEDSSITLPKKPVTQPGEIVFEITVSKNRRKMHTFISKINKQRSWSKFDITKTCPCNIQRFLK